MGPSRYCDYMAKRAASFERAGIRHGFTARQEGDFRHEPLPEAVSTARQVHGTRVIEARAAGRLSDEADALLARAGQGAGVLTADCVPILLCDPQAGLAAAIHAGWRGTLAGVASAAGEALVRAGADPRRVLAAIGPCIRSCCYEVSEELSVELAHALGPEVVPSRRHVDLALANQKRLVALGIPEGNVEDLGECTCCTRDGEAFRYFSHRRDGSPGRQLSWIRA